jgi:hypothetical protein
LSNRIMSEKKKKMTEFCQSKGMLSTEKSLGMEHPQAEN